MMNLAAQQSTIIDARGIINLPGMCDCLPVNKDFKPMNTRITWNNIQKIQPGLCRKLWLISSLVPSVTKGIQQRGRQKITRRINITQPVSEYILRPVYSKQGHYRDQINKQCP